MSGPETGFNPTEMSALPQQTNEFQGDVTPVPESRDDRKSIAAKLYRIVREVEQGN